MRGQSISLVCPACRSPSVFAGSWPLPPSPKPAVANGVLLKWHFSDSYFSASLVHLQGYLWSHWTRPDNPGGSPHLKVSWLATLLPLSWNVTDSNVPGVRTCWEQLFCSMCKTFGTGSSWPPSLRYFSITPSITSHYLCPVHCGSLSTGLPGSLLPFCNIGLPF